MQVAKVIGKYLGDKKEEKLSGLKLLLVKPHWMYWMKQ